MQWVAEKTGRDKGSGGGITWVKAPPGVEMRHGLKWIKRKKGTEGEGKAGGDYINYEGGWRGCRATLGCDSPGGGEGREEGADWGEAGVRYHFSQALTCSPGPAPFNQRYSNCTGLTFWWGRSFVLGGEGGGSGGGGCCGDDHKSFSGCSPVSVWKLYLKDKMIRGDKTFFVGEKQYEQQLQF